MNCRVKINYKRTDNTEIFNFQNFTTQTINVESDSIQISDI